VDNIKNIDIKIELEANSSGSEDAFTTEKKISSDEKKHFDLSRSPG